MSALPLDNIEAQRILVERIERYAKARRIGSLAEAVERLTRVGLFVEAAPDGARLVKRGGRTEWRAPSAAPAEADGDIPF